MIIEKVFIFFTLPLLFNKLEAQDVPESCPAGEHRVSGKCELCPPGTYRKHIPVSWYENKDECQVCPKGTFQSHFGAVGEDLCQKCPLGTFAAKEGSVTCQKCPEGELSPKGSSACIACPAGSKAVTDEQDKLRCVKCETFSYRSLEMKTCQKCPPFTGALESGAESCVRCEKGEECFRCGYNKFRPSWNTTCLKCPRGTYTEYVNATSVSECLPCPEGTKRNIRDFFCERCDRGSVTGPGGIICRREGKPCPFKFFENSVGDCHTCASGYRLNRALLKCEKCPDGTVGRGGITEHCYACPANQIVSPTGKRCECPKGRYLRGERCVRCPIGRTMNIANRKTSCRRCIYGRAPRRGMTQCIPCPDGSANDVVREICVRCDGKDQLILGTGIYKTCVNPRTGCREDEFRMFYDSEFESYICRQRACTDETPAEEIGVKCVLCSKGFFVTDDELWWSPEKICASCPDGETSEGGTTTECVKCPPYHFPDYRTGQCICNHGLVKVEDSCTFCPAGSSSEDGFTCTPCEPGYYANQINIYCERCPKNTYSPSGVAVCLTCPSGTRPNRRYRATECVPV